MPFIVKDLGGKDFVTVTNTYELNELINEIRYYKSFKMDAQKARAL